MEDKFVNIIITKTFSVDDTRAQENFFCEKHDDQHQLWNYFSAYDEKPSERVPCQGLRAYPNMIAEHFAMMAILIGQRVVREKL